MTVLWLILRDSRVLQTVVLVLGLWGAFLANNAYQRAKGAATATAKIEAKADETATIASEVRTEVRQNDVAPSGKRGPADPYRRP